MWSIPIRAMRRKWKPILIGARLIKDGKLYQIPRRLQHIQARRADINYRCRTFRPKHDGREWSVLHGEVF